MYARCGEVLYIFFFFFYFFWFSLLFAGDKRVDVRGGGVRNCYSVSKYRCEGFAWAIYKLLQYICNL